jgi:hypothetical protein
MQWPTRRASLALNIICGSLQRKELSCLGSNLSRLTLVRLLHCIIILFQHERGSKGYEMAMGSTRRFVARFAGEVFLRKKVQVPSAKPKKVRQKSYSRRLSACQNDSTTTRFGEAEQRRFQRVFRNRSLCPRALFAFVWLGQKVGSDAHTRHFKTRPVVL